jgi:hypothetical protein
MAKKAKALFHGRPFQPGLIFVYSQYGNDDFEYVFYHHKIDSVDNLDAYWKRPARDNKHSSLLDPYVTKKV